MKKMSIFINEWLENIASIFVAAQESSHEQRSTSFLILSVISFNFCALRVQLDRWCGGGGKSSSPISIVIVIVLFIFIVIRLWWNLNMGAREGKSATSIVW